MKVDTMLRLDTILRGEREGCGRHDQHARASEKRYDRVIKSFKMETFEGSSFPGALDSGISAWITRFQALLNTQEDLQDLQLPDRMKNALLFQHLRGVVSQRYVANIHKLRSHSFEYVCGKVRSEFSSKLSNQQIMLMVASERKKHAETYREYSLHLRAMAAAATTTGLETIDSNNGALSSFIVNAWYKHTDNLRLVIREDSDRPLREMDRAINKLCSIAGRQGIVKTTQPRSSGAPQAEIKFAKVASNHTKSTLGKRKVNFKNESTFKRRDFSKARCDTCGELGHTTGYHDKYILLKQGGLAQVARASASKPPSEADASTGKEEDESFESYD
ncbi:unnamed protein product [Phytophthora fragariaefolia]|uniref:Unnamed protein product n=1 Tax=Phytophthora fragariaefolia TaxID=1490495 RepID=A0A9W6YNU9_9STRA|nr:unnamed protein product [Phytophthora fragariaefolia]